MKPKEIKELIDFIATSGLNEVNIETNEFKINVKREVEAKVIAGTAAPAMVSAAPVATPVAVPQAPAKTETKTEASSSGTAVEIKSPMIGTFYRSANPESPAFVNVGDEVKKGQVLCIIEAMKLFNEIESEVSGTVVKILADNKSPVEYDQPLFLIEPK